MTDEWSDDQWSAMDAAIRTAAHAILADGPMPLRRLTEVLVERGALDAFEGCELSELTEIVDDALVETDHTWTSHDGTVCLTSALMHGVVLTHRVSQSELGRGVLDSTPDLGVITWGSEHGWALADGGHVSHDYPHQGQAHLDEHGSYVGPAGWLGGLRPGQLVGVTLDADRFTLVHDVTPVPSKEEAALLREVFDGMCDDAFVVEIDQLILELLLRAPTMFRTPTLPIGDLIDGAGLRVRGGWVGRADHDFVTPGERYRKELLERLVSEYRLDRCCRDALERLIAHWAAFVVAPPDHRAEISDSWNPRILFEDFHHGAVIQAFVDYIWDRHNHRVELLDHFAEELAMTDELEPSALYLVASNALRGGAAGEALRAMQRAASVDDVIGPSLELHATLLADAGRPAEALAALRRAAALGAPEHEITFLGELLRTFTAANRNDPCPCGSGRKYKQCCQHDPKLSQIDRRRLAMHQATRSLYEHHRRQTSFSLALDAFEASGAPLSEMQQRMSRFISDPFLIDLAVFDEAGIANYLRERREIIPPAELSWLAELSATRRTIWSYRRLDGNEFEVTDAVNGETTRRITLDGRAFGDEGCLLARVVEDSLTGTVGVLGPAHEISVEQRDELLDLLQSGAGGHELAAWYGVQTAGQPVTG